MIVFIGVAWSYISYIKTFHFRESGNIIMGYIFPVLGIIFVLMGIFILNSVIKSFKEYKKNKEQDSADYFEDQFVNIRSREDTNIDRIHRQKLDKNYEDINKNLSYFKKKFDDIIARDEDTDMENTEATTEKSQSFKFCPFCGETLEKNYKYCPECGKKLQK
ncbi:Hypothetical protein ING2D1G_0153 [Peptoniphilus sp. ING2-D1G]|nr:Hypothetical protein ING2D1G_0153 [Peptoniphilus sp. ING2-D1G]